MSDIEENINIDAQDEYEKNNDDSISHALASSEQNNFLKESAGSNNNNNNKESNNQINEEEINEEEINEEEINEEEINEEQITIGVLTKETILEQIKKNEETLFRMMTILRYKYEYYEFRNLVLNILIILCSSVITFLESLRANIAQDDNIDFWFTIITLSLGFVIAFTLSLFKFLKIQDKMEVIQSGLLGLMAPYKEICEFTNKIEGNWIDVKQLNIDENIKKENINNSQQWKIIKIKAVHPLTHATNIISSGEYYIYQKRFEEQRLKTNKMKNKMDLQEEAQKNLKKAKEIILKDMSKPTEELYDKYGPINNMKRANDIRLEYWNEGVIMSNNMQNKYNKVLGIKNYDKCFNNCVDVYCCLCNSWCKKFFKSIIYFFMCCCPRSCSSKDKRQHEWRREEREEV